MWYLTMYFLPIRLSVFEIRVVKNKIALFNRTRAIYGILKYIGINC